MTSKSVWGMQGISCPIDRPYPFHIYWHPRVLMGPPFFALVLRSFFYGGLSLVSIVNPGYSLSKSDNMTAMAREHPEFFVPHCKYPRSGESPERVADALSEAGLHFPIVVKPDSGRTGHGVRLLADEEDLARYLQSSGPDVTLHFQQYIDLPGEAGAFYVRHPGERRGQVVSLALKSAPCVVGDGTSTVEQLIVGSGRPRFLRRQFFRENRPYLQEVLEAGERRILSFRRNITKGAIYHDATHEITPELSRTIDAIAQGLGEFYYGRFDIKFRTVDELLQGKALIVNEVNGTYSGDGRLYSENARLVSSLRDLILLQEQLLKIGAANRARGYEPVPLLSLVKSYVSFWRKDGHEEFTNSATV